MPLQIRRGTDAERRAMTVPLAQGELLYVTDDQRLYIGNGATLGGVQITGYTNEDAQDAAAGLFTGGTHSGISFTYDDAGNKVNASINLTNYNGFIKGDLEGSVFADNSTRLIDGTNGQFNLNGTINTNVVPSGDSLYDLGSSVNKFRDLYLSGSSIHLGDAVITSSGTAVNLPAGSLIAGKPIGVPGGDLNVNIVADDSTVIVNTVTEVVTAQGGFIGNIKGTVTAADNSTLLDSTAKTLSVTSLTATTSNTNIVYPVSGTAITVGSDSKPANTEIIGESANPVLTASCVVSGSTGLGQASPIVRISGYRGTHASKTVLGLGDAIGQLNFQGTINAGSYGVQNADLASVRAVIANAGDLVSTIAQSKLQFILVNGPNPSDVKTAEFDNTGTLYAPVVKTGSYAGSGAYPSSPAAGMIIFDSSNNHFYGYNGTLWKQLDN